MARGAHVVQMAVSSTLDFKVKFKANIRATCLKVWKCFFANLVRINSSSGL